MSNEIITQQIMPPGMLAVGQTGKNNVNVTNQQGGIVNFNYNIQQGAVIGCGHWQRRRNDGCSPLQ